MNTGGHYGDLLESRPILTTVRPGLSQGFDRICPNGVVS